MSPGLKLIYSTLLSCAILLHIFGNYLWLTLALSVVIYALTSALRARAGKPIFAFSMLALSLAHFYRMYTDYGGWKIDITSILMINVGKYSYFSFWYQDQLADSPQTARLPSLPMYLAYMLFLPCNILGPVFTYAEF
jgi:lysophospholipid acyltransferase